MVTGNHSYEEQTRRRLSEAKTKAHELEEQLKLLDKQSLRLTREISAYEIILEGYKDTTQIDWFNLLQSLTHKDKLLVIAKESDGRIGLSQATDILYSNKLTTAKKRATVYQMVRNIIGKFEDDNIFKWVRSGEYQLVDAQPSLAKHFSK